MRRRSGSAPHDPNPRMPAVALTPGLHDSHRGGPCRGALAAGPQGHSPAETLVVGCSDCGKLGAPEGAGQSRTDHPALRSCLRQRLREPAGGAGERGVNRRTTGS
jgi:hypothetical protein